MIIPAELYCGRGIGFRPSMNLIFCGVGAFEVANTEYGKKKTTRQNSVLVSIVRYLGICSRKDY
jgi:hypothetical protein